MESGGCGVTRHDEDLREPLVRRQGSCGARESQVSMRMARGSVSLLSSHGSQARTLEWVAISFFNA